MAVCFKYVISPETAAAAADLLLPSKPETSR